MKSQVQDALTTELCRSGRHVSAMFSNGARAMLEVPCTAEAMQRGLAGRDSLLPDHGMLFRFRDAGVHLLQMLDVRFPLDCLFLDERGVIVAIESSVPARREGLFGHACRAAVELPGGWAVSHRLSVGDRMLVE